MFHFNKEHAVHKGPPLTVVICDGKSIWLVFRIRKSTHEVAVICFVYGKKAISSAFKPLVVVIFFKTQVRSGYPVSLFIIWTPTFYQKLKHSYFPHFHSVKYGKRYVVIPKVPHVRSFCRFAPSCLFFAMAASRQFVDIKD